MTDAAGRRRQAERRGRRAETVAALWLAAKGYRVLARGFRTRQGEVDLIVRRGAIVAAVEVKTRAATAAALEAVLARQRQRVAAAALLYLSRLPDGASLALRFDIVVIVPWRLPYHIMGAWEP
jgi:putative endonuclease